MYLYNISIIVEESNHSSLLEWLRSVWLPSIENEVSLLKMLNTPHEGHTYCVQIITKNESDIQDFNERHLSLLQQHISIQHVEKAFLFDSVMQYLTP